MADAAQSNTPQEIDPGMVSAWYKNYMSTQPQVATYAPTTWTPTQDQMVQNQLSGILAKGSPLQTWSQAQSNQAMNARGLLNSSIAVGEGQNAVIRSALPIAMQDANTLAQAGQFNANAANQAGQFNANAQNAALGQQAGAGISAAMTQMQIQGQQALQSAQHTFAAAQAQLDRAQQIALADKSIEAQKALQLAQQQFTGAQAQLEREQQTALQLGQQKFTGEQAQLTRDQQVMLQQMAGQQQRDLLQLQNQISLANVPKAFAAQTSQTVMAQVGTILADPNLTPDAKGAAIDNAIAYANSTLQWAHKLYGVDMPGIAPPPRVEMPAKTQGQEQQRPEWLDNPPQWWKQQYPGYDERWGTTPP